MVKTWLRIRCEALACVALVVLVLFTGARPLTAAQPQAGRIDSIAPAAARLVERVTISGIGFGGRNVKILVGGVPAKVLAATGSRVTFLVPDGIAPGATRVTATNPGGHVGAIEFRVLFGIVPQVVTQDDARAVSAVVPPQGGAITATASDGTVYSLHVPPGALDTPIPITLTPVTAMANVPFSGDAVAVQLEPNGLRLARPATLMITLPSRIDPSRALGFVFNDAGTTLELVPVTVNQATVTLHVEHFSSAGAAQAAAANFASQVQPLISALPPTLPPTQVANLVSLLLSWIGNPQFGFTICTGTTLCQQVLDIAHQSLVSHRDQACAQGAAFIQQGEPFLAREALKEVAKIAAYLVELEELAEQAQVPGFNSPLDLACIAGTLSDIIRLAKDEAIINIGLLPLRSGALFLLVDVLNDAFSLVLTDVVDEATKALREVLTTLLDQANQTCATDHLRGEELFDFPLDNFGESFLDALETGLGGRFRDARAGCRVRISPPLPTVGLGEQLQFTGTVEGLSPPGVTWSIQSPALGSTIDPQTGLFSAGETIGMVVVVATSVGDTTLFKRATVTIAESICPAPTAFSALAPQGAAATCVQAQVFFERAGMEVGVGVSPQGFLGRTEGKVENCQVGPGAGSCSRSVEVDQRPVPGVEFSGKAQAQVSVSGSGVTISGTVKSTVAAAGADAAPPNGATADVRASATASAFFRVTGAPAALTAVASGLNQPFTREKGGAATFAFLSGPDEFRVDLLAGGAVTLPVGNYSVILSAGARANPPTANAATVTNTFSLVVTVR